MEKISLKQRTLTNVSYNFVSYVWAMLFSILITPIIILKLGVQEYGVFLFVTAVSGFVSVIVSGVDMSSIRHIAHYHGSQNMNKIIRLVRTMNSVFLIVALIGSSIIVVGFLFGSRAIPQTALFTHNQLFLFFGLAAVNFFIQTSSRIYQVIPAALQRFDITSKMSIATLTSSSVGTLVLILSGYGVASLFVLQVAITLLTVVAYYIISKKLLPESLYKLELHNDEIKTCLRFGSLSSINEFARTSLMSLDRILIPVFAGGVSQLTYYSVPGNLAARIPGIADNLSGSMFPTSTNLHGAGQKDQLKTLYVRSTRLITTLSIAISVGIIFNAEKIMHFWINENFAQNSTDVFIILTITNLLLSLLSPITSFFMGMNKLKFNTVLSFSMAVLNIGALAILLPHFGIIGAAWAYLISVLPIFFAVYVIEKRYLNLKNRTSYYAGFITKHIFTTVVTGGLVVYFTSPLIVNFVTLAIFGPMSVVLYITLFLAFGFMDKDDVIDILKFTKIDRNKVEEKKLKFKLFIRKFMPGFLLNSIKRRQVPLDKMVNFKKLYTNKIINEDTKTSTLAVVMPCYNHSQFITHALESIVSQTRYPDEIILVNDCSKDDTKDVIENFIKMHPEAKNIILVNNEKNLGQALSINKGIELSKSDLVMIMNDDDYLFKNTVEVAIKLIKENPKLSLVGGAQIPFENDSEIDKDKIVTVTEKFETRYPEDVLKYEDYCSLNMTHTGSVFSREKAISCGMYRIKEERIVKFSDRDFQIRMNLLYPVSVNGKVSFCFWRTNSSVDSGKNS